MKENTGNVLYFTNEEFIALCGKVSWEGLDVSGDRVLEKYVLYKLGIGSWPRREL